MKLKLRYLIIIISVIVIAVAGFWVYQGKLWQKFLRPKQSAPVFEETLVPVLSIIEVSINPKSYSEADKSYGAAIKDSAKPIKILFSDNTKLYSTGLKDYKGKPLGNRNFTFSEFRWVIEMGTVPQGFTVKGVISRDGGAIAAEEVFYFVQPKTQ